MTYLICLFRIRLNLKIAKEQSCKNVPTVPTSWCYFFWPVLIFGKNTRKQAKNRRFFGANFLGGKLVGANFYAFCNYGYQWQNFTGNPFMTSSCGRQRGVGKLALE